MMLWEGKFLDGRLEVQPEDNSKANTFCTEILW